MPGRSLGILALLDRRHPPPSGSGWDTDSIAEICGVSYWTVAHLLDRLRRYGHAEDLKDVRFEEVRRLPGSQGGVEGSIPITTLRWTTTEKGSVRLGKRGGHADWCPICKPSMRGNTYKKRRSARRRN